MYLGEYTKTTQHKRQSKHGTNHTYSRNVTIVKLRCDNCDTLFERLRSSMSPNRLNNNFFHVCNNCNAKKFAQKKGVEKRKIWNLTASSSLDISKL